MQHTAYVLAAERKKAEHGKYCLLCWDKIQQRNANYKLTDEQRKRKNERASERYKELKAAGICVNCAKRKTDGKHVTCDICRLAKLARDRDKAHANGVVSQDLRGHGFCTRCYKPTDGKVCAECYAVLVKQRKSDTDITTYFCCTFCKAEYIVRKEPILRVGGIKNGK